MKKSLAIIALAFLATAGVHAGVELRTSFAPDQQGVYIVEIVDTDTNEVINSKRFQYNDAGIVQSAASAPVLDQEETEGLEEAGAPTTSGIDSVVDTSDEPDVTDVVNSGIDDDIHTKEVGKWDEILELLGSAKTSLSKFYTKLQSLYPSEDAEASDEEATLDTTLVVPADEGTVEETVVVEEPEVKQ